MKKQDSHLHALLKPMRSKKLSGPTHTSGHGGHGGMTSIRRDEHRGRKIEVHTTYKILVDGKPLKMHTSVMNNGKVHCHSLPQYAFPSAIRMVKGVIDVMDIEVPPNELKPYSTSGKNKKSHGSH